MNKLDVDLSARADIDRQSVRINAGNGSPLEFAYTLVYLLSLSGGVGIALATMTAVIALYVAKWEWVWVALLALFVAAITTAVTHLLLMVSLKLLMETYGGNYQPRSDDGRFVPVNHGGKLAGWLKTAGKRDKNGITRWGRGEWIEKKSP